MDFTDILERLYEAEIDKFLPHIKNDLSQMFTKTLKYIDNNSKYINPIDGDIYQLKTLILYLYRGISHKYSFRLDTEVKKAKQFNNLIFKYIQNDNNFHRVLQVKYKLDKTEKITAHNLLEENEGDYSLVKYFFSYQDLKADKSINNGLIKNFTVCTNINFDFKNLTEKRIEVQRLKSIDYILKLRSDQKQSIRYKFKQDMGQLLKKKLLEFRAHESNKITGHLDDEIKDFLNNFIFAVEQPSEEELIEIINQEIGEEFDFITTENLYNKFFMKMLDWLQSKEKNTFLSYLKGKEFFEEMKNQFHNQLRFKECINQFKILILFLHRGISHEYSFQLGIKPKDFQQFDHLIFKYIQNDISIYHLLQVKYKLDESKKITAYNLLEENEGDYSLIKYFFAYQEFKVDKSFEGGSIKYFTVCTNINFNFKDLNNSKIKVQKLKNVEDIFSFEKYNGNTSIELMLKPSARYKFNIDDILISSLKSKLACNTNRSPEQLHDEIKEFLDHFIFAIEQPSEKELNKIIKLEMGKEFNLISIKNANNFLITMFNSLQDKDIHTFLSHDEGNEFLDKIKKLIHIWFDIENPIESFTGRIEELKNLHRMLQSQDNISKSNIVFVSGHNGIGKTQLVKKYISINSQSYDNKIIWINAENYESLAGSFWKIATNELKIATKRYCKNRSWEKDIRLLIEDVYRYFSNGKCLFVFDVQKYELDCRIKNFFINLQSYYKYPYIIITSRTQKWPKNIKVIDLHIFKKEEAINFVENSLSINGEQKCIKELVEKLQFLPLILQLAVAYIKTQNNNLENLELIHHVDNYIKNFIQKTSGYVNSNSIGDSDNDYSKTTYSVYHMTLDAIRASEYGEYALMILNVMSYLDSNNVPVEIMLELIKDKKRLDSAIELLKQYSVIGVQNNKLFLHRIIQQITRSQLANQNKEKEILVESIKLFDKVTNENVDCAISIWNHIGKYNNLIEKYSNFMNSISFVLIKNGRYEEAYSFEQKKFRFLSALLQSNEELKIINDPNLIMTKNNIAYLMIKQGKYNLAFENFQYIYNVRKDDIGLDHSDTWSVQNSIASTLVELNKPAEAVELCKQLLGQKKIYILLTHELLGRIYINWNKPKEAFPILLVGHNLTFVKNNPIDRVCIENYIAVTLMQQNEKQKSLIRFSEINKILNNLSPMNYSAIIFLKHNAALMLHKLDKVYTLTIYDEILKIQKKFLEENHPDILATQSTIAKIYMGHKKEYSYKSALDLYNKIYDELRNTADFLDPNFLDIQFNKALAHQHLGDYNDALALFEEILIKQNIIVGENHPDTLETINHIATLFFNLDHIDKALELFKKNLILQQNTLGVDHLKTLTTKYNIGKILHMKKNFNESVPIFKELFPKLSVIVGNIHFINMMSSIALMFFKQQDYVTALKYFKSADCSLKVLPEGSLINYDHKTNEKHLQVNISEVINYINAILWIQGNWKQMDHFIIKVLSAELLDGMKNNDFNKVKTMIKAGGKEIVNFLLDDKANSRLISNKGIIILHVATSENHKHIVELLLNKNCKNGEFLRFVNIKNGKDGTTPLHIAAKNGYLDIVKILLKNGASYDIRNNHYNTALELSKNGSIKNLLKLIDGFFQAVNRGNLQTIELEAIKLDELEALLGCTNCNAQKFQDIIKLRRNRLTLDKVSEIYREKSMFAKQSTKK